MVGFIHNIGLPETILVAVVAILVFGKRLPEVAVRAAVQVQKMRRALADLRRETGIDAEIRAAQRSVENAVSRDVLSSSSRPLPPPRPTEDAMGDESKPATAPEPREEPGS